jgi:hypothetical protein
MQEVKSLGLTPLGLAHEVGLELLAERIVAFEQRKIDVPGRKARPASTAWFGTR